MTDSVPSPTAPKAPPRIGVLLANPGTPDAPDAGAVRRYLREFLSDPRVVEIPALLWQPILRGVVLRTRPAKSAHAYAQVWDHARRASPLRAITEDQVQALQGAFGPDVTVDHAMRYGTPSIADAIDRLHAASCTRILLAPLYPQYCAATTASVVDAAGAALARRRWQPALRTLPPYYDDPAYVAALAEDIGHGIAGLDFEPQALLLSFHGMPERTRKLGDPYHDQCVETARLLGKALGRDVLLSFQSRFGRAKWLEPSTESMLAALPGRDVRRLAVCAPGFSADCLETLEELAIRGRQTFLSGGGENFAYLPCLNARPTGIEMLRKILARELEGWLPRF